MESVVEFVSRIPNTGILIGAFVGCLTWVWVMTWLGRLATATVGIARAGGQAVPDPEGQIDSFASLGSEGSPGSIDARRPGQHRGIASLMASHSDSVITRRVSSPNQVDDVTRCPLVGGHDDLSEGVRLMDFLGSMPRAPRKRSTGQGRGNAETAQASQTEPSGPGQGGELARMVSNGVRKELNAIGEAILAKSARELRESSESLKRLLAARELRVELELACQLECCGQEREFTGGRVMRNWLNGGAISTSCG